MTWPEGYHQDEIGDTSGSDWKLDHTGDARGGRSTQQRGSGSRSRTCEEDDHSEDTKNEEAQVTVRTPKGF